MAARIICDSLTTTFKIHFETVVNPTNEAHHDGSLEATDVTIQVLDEPITPAEVQDQSRKMKPDKVSGPDGIPPGIFALLPVQWILSIMTLFNSIFSSGVYPQAWIRAKIFTIFKKGDKANPNNYRGISVINNLAVRYDSVPAVKPVVQAF